MLPSSSTKNTPKIPFFETILHFSLYLKNQFPNPIPEHSDPRSVSQRINISTHTTPKRTPPSHPTKKKGPEEEEER